LGDLMVERLVPCRDPCVKNGCQSTSRMSVRFLYVYIGVRWCGATLADTFHKECVVTATVYPCGLVKEPPRFQRRTVHENPACYQRPALGRSPNFCILIVTVRSRRSPKKSFMKNEQRTIRNLCQQDEVSKYRSHDSEY
jgi:hypothetical protein